MALGIGCTAVIASLNGSLELRKPPEGPVDALDRGFRSHVDEYPVQKLASHRIQAQKCFAPRKNALRKKFFQIFQSDVPRGG
jgi:hypothetical protein